MLEAVPMIPRDDTVFKVFKEKEEDLQPDKVAPHTMSSEAMRTIFNNLTSGAGRRAEQEYNTDSTAHHKANSIEGNVKSVRLSTQIHVTDWAEAQCEDPEIEATIDWCHLDKKKLEPWTEQLAKLKSRLGSKKNTPEERSTLWNADKLTLSGRITILQVQA